ncbi:MAG: AAA family ATPase [Gemmatimonadetes bacterium]|nr:AAA family ATPase [Gemmatimonadota bacterium]
MSASYPCIPYGWADFRAIRLENRLYVDKTRFVHALEEERYVFLIRPCRFGKSCWVSLLENYYDRTRADEFEAIFGGTDLGRQPTENRHRYVVLRFDFSAFDATLETLRERFETYCHSVVRRTLERNQDLFPEKKIQRILSRPSIDAKLNELFLYTGDHGIPLYVIIDEYDNVANTVLAPRGEPSQSFTHGGDLYRNFFAMLKVGAGQSYGGIERLFITGVLPIAMDDVTSGFNISRNISLEPEFNDMLGFTEEEVRGLLEMYRDHGVFNQDVEAALEVMREWYNGYRFAIDAEDDLYSTDMVLYYLKASLPNQPIPDDLIAPNMPSDYSRWLHLLTANRQLNGNFDLFRHIIDEQVAESNIQTILPLERLDQLENFLSLLYYFGLLSIRGVSHGVPRLGIPNQTVKRLMHGYLGDA